MGVSPLVSRIHWRLKRIRYLWSRFRGSVALRGWRGTITRLGQEFERRPALDDTLPIAPLEIPFEPFQLPTSEQPLVSIVIPVYGKLQYTLSCLRSLSRHPSKASTEVIVVDDASPENSEDVFAQIAGLRWLRNAHNMGFVGTCNAGAHAARGQFLVFLNNDTQVTPDWLDHLLACFSERADCGIAGSRLVYPDGRLQEAGGLVFADGSCWNIGRFEQRDASSWSYRRKVDYVSGAALMIRRAVFQEIGGFDIRYMPAYYEDTDLAFAVRQAGLRVYYEPASTVIHYEGISSGIDLHSDSGVKRHQLINREKFADKWRAQLVQQPPADIGLEKALRWGRRGRVLIVDSTVPDPTRDSGSLRLCSIFKILDEQGWNVCFFPDDHRATATDIKRLGSLGTELLYDPVAAHLPQWLSANGASLHAVMLSRHAVAGQYAALVRKFAPQARLIFDTVDLHYLREERAAALSGSATMARQAQASRRSELALIATCDTTFVVSPHEQALLARELPEAKVELLSNIHDVHGTSTTHAERRDLVFIGGYGHPPNADAMAWIAKEMAPLLAERLPNTRIHILGDVPETARQTLQSTNVEFHGRVPDLTPWLDTCLASLAPLRFGAGVKGKINMAMSCGVPVIATAIAVEGMQLNDGVDVLVAEHAKDYIDAVQRLVQDETLWDTLSINGLENVRRHFSFEAAAETLRRAIK